MKILTSLGALALLAAPAQGGEILIGGTNGTSDQPTPTQGAKTEEDWNPTVTCSLEWGQGLYDLLACLQNEISNPPPPCPAPNPECTGPRPCPVPPRRLDDPDTPCFSYSNARQDFHVWVIEWGVLILRLDYTEINRLTFREDDPGIQTTELRLNEAAVGRVARVRLVEEIPSGAGMVYLTVNDTTVSVSTSAFQTPYQINAELIQQLGVPFSVTVAGAYLHIHIRAGMGDGIHRVQFRSTDSGIVKSDLSLLPNDDQTLLAD
jgi:hypothetical protein